MEQEMAVERTGHPFATARYTTVAPEIMTRGHHAHPLRVVKERSLDGFRRVERFHAAAPGGTFILPLDGASWADWDHAGRLIVLRHGTVSVADVVDGQVQPLRELIDLTADTFEPREPPASAKQW
jgi:hypothetical protein